MMDFFSSSKVKKHGKRSGFFGKKATSKSTPPSPPRVAGDQSPKPYYFSDKRAETEHAFPTFDEDMRYYRKQPASERIPNSHPRPSSEEHIGYYGRQPVSERVPNPHPKPTSNEHTEYYRKQPASERIPNSHYKPPTYGYGTPDRRRDHGREKFAATYEPEANVTPRNSSPPSPVHPAGSRSPPPPHFSSSDDDQSTYLYPEIASPYRSRPVSGSSTPVHYEFQIGRETDEHEKETYEPPELPDESQSFTLSEIARLRGFKNFEGKEEVQSMISEAQISVGNYKVRASVSATLQHILDKQGDIAAASKLQSISTRSYYLESLSAVVLELKSTPLCELTKTRIGEIVAVVKDMESVKIDVSWLKGIVTELAEAVEYYGQHEAAKAEKEVCERDLLLAKQEMEERMAELGQKEREIRDCREKVTANAARLGQLEMKGSRLDKNLLVFRSKVEKFDGESVMVKV